MKMEVETITPEKATSYLEGNRHNRPIRQSHVQFLMKEIKLGRWRLNGQPIIFNGNDLLDGQHRLWAVIEAGKGIKTTVVREVEEGAFSTLDTGRSRTAGDVLSIRGEESGATLAAAARFCLGYKRGLIMHNEKYSNAEILEFVDENPGLVTSLNFIKDSAKKKWLLPNGGAAALHFLFSKKDEDLANMLLLGLISGFPASAPKVFVDVREKLISLSLQSGSFRIWQLAFHVVKAWNAYRRGETIKVFRIAEHEKFPVIS